MNLQKIKDIEMMNELVKSGEITTFSKAIKAKCLDCANYEMSEVRNCTVTNCPLWAFRMGRRLKKETED